MAKGPSKAEVILHEARMRAEEAKELVRLARQNLNIAEAAARGHVDAYDALAKALTPKPRKKPATATPAQAKLPTDKKAEAAKADAPKSNGQLCTAIIPGLGVECADPASASIHDPNGGYSGYHPFDTSAPAQSAEKKSKKKAAAASITPNSEIEKVAAISAGAD